MRAETMESAAADADAAPLDLLPSRVQRELAEVRAEQDTRVRTVSLRPSGLLGFCYRVACH